MPCTPGKPVSAYAGDPGTSVCGDAVTRQELAPEAPRVPQEQRGRVINSRETYLHRRPHSWVTSVDAEKSHRRLWTRCACRPPLPFRGGSWRRSGGKERQTARNRLPELLRRGTRWGPQVTARAGTGEGWGQAPGGRTLRDGAPDELRLASQGLETVLQRVGESTRAFGNILGELQRK